MPAFRLNRSKDQKLENNADIPQSNKIGPKSIDQCPPTLKSSILAREGNAGKRAARATAKLVTVVEVCNISPASSMLYVKLLPGGGVLGTGFPLGDGVLGTGFPLGDGVFPPWGVRLPPEELILLS
jgi:hypothetical protein